MLRSLVGSEMCIRDSPGCSQAQASGTHVRRTSGKFCGADARSGGRERVFARGCITENRLPDGWVCCCRPEPAPQPRTGHSGVRHPLRCILAAGFEGACPVAGVASATHLPIVGKSVSPDLGPPTLVPVGLAQRHQNIRRLEGKCANRGAQPGGVI